MNQEAQHELRELAQDWTYNYILHAGLAKLLSNEDWDSFAASLADKAMIFIERLVEERIDEIQAEQEEMEAIA